MITSAADERIKEVRTTADELVVALADGRTLSVPLVWYPRLLHASAAQRSDWRFIADGEGVHWPQIDEDLSAAGLLRGVPAPAARPRPSRAREISDQDRSPGETGGAEFEIYEDQTNPGEFRWRLRANNNEIIAASSESYRDKDDALHHIELMKAHAPGAVVEEVT